MAGKMYVFESELKDRILFLWMFHVCDTRACVAPNCLISAIVIKCLGFETLFRTLCHCPM